MSSKTQLDALGNRLKTYEQHETSKKFIPNLPIYVRLDGRGFSKFTKGMARPFDERMSNLMIATTSYLVKELNAVIGYTQSDEISLIFNNEYESPTIFDGKIQKIISTLSALASSFFVYNFSSYFFEDIAQYSNRLPTFDARAFNIPNIDEAVNCIYWRYLDCNKNAVSMAAHHYFSHKSLHKQNVSKMKNRLLVEQNIIFDKYPSFFKDGTFVKNQSYTKVVNDQSVLRHKVDVKPLTKSFNLYTHEERKEFIFN